MPILNIKVTNPEAIELLRKIKSREILIPILAWLKKYRWYLIAFSVVFALLIALIIGKVASEKTPVPVFVPPDIESTVPTESISIKSDFSGLKDEILNINTDLPDPAIPVFDNVINLEETIN